MLVGNISLLSKIIGVRAGAIGRLGYVYEQVLVENAAGHKCLV